MKIIFWYDDKYKGLTEIARCNKGYFKSYAAEILEDYIDSGLVLYYTQINGDEVTTKILDYYNEVT